MKHKLDFINPVISQIKDQNLYRQLRYGRVNGAYITINKKKLLNLCSNDYLGIPIKKGNVMQMQSSSRLVSGNDNAFQTLEKKLSRHKSQEEGLVFPTGYMANLGSISTLIQKGDLVLSDKLNHASIIEACRLSGATISIYQHNDIDDLCKKIKKKNRRKFIISEGIFSMDGDFAKLKQITEIAEKNNLITILDDAHGDFTVGRDGKGSAEYFGVAKKIDLYISSLSKGLGSFGGYIASQKNIIDLCINKARSFIYTSALPSFLVEYSLKKFESNRKKQQKKLSQNVQQLLRGLRQSEYKIDSETHIIPILIGKEKIALDFGKFLFNNGIYAQPIRYPTVPKNKARIRISVTALLSKKDIDYSISVFEAARKKFRI